MAPTRMRVSEGRPPRFREVAHGVFAATLFSPGTCRSLVSSVRQAAHWETAGVAVLKQGKFENAIRRKDRHANVMLLEEAPAADGVLRKTLAGAVRQSAEALYACAFTGINHLQLIQYGRGGKFKLHTDSGPGTEDRMVTVLCYLNDGFSGGSTVFPYVNFCYRPRAGDVVLFPSEWPHAAEPVRSGEKYVCVGFYVGKSPVNWM